MSHRYISVISLSLVIMLGGCAGSPRRPAESTAPGPDYKSTSMETATDADAEFQAALQLMESGDWHGAADRLSAIVAAKPRLSGAWTNLGIARIKIGDAAGAEEAFKRAIEMNANQLVAYNELGILYRRSGRLEEAAAIYNEGLRIKPDAEEIHWNLGVLYDRYLPNPAQALFHYERYRQLTQSEDRQLLAWISELRGKTSQVNPANGAKR